MLGKVPSDAACGGFVAIFGGLLPSRKARTRGGFCAGSHIGPNQHQLTIRGIDATMHVSHTMRRAAVEGYSPRERRVGGP